MTRTALIMAGGTGGHVFPGLAVADELRTRGWQIYWLGHPEGMESRLVPQHGIPVEPVLFGGVRGKGWLTKLLLPLRLLRAFWQSLQVIRRVQPNVVLGMGGYIAFPGGMMAALCGKPLVVHEQNSVAGLTNKVLASVADRVLEAFPASLKQARWTGNPVRHHLLNLPSPAERYAARANAQGQQMNPLPLHILVVGGSLGAQALNQIVPQALALLPAAQRPTICHQAGTQHLPALHAAYAAAGLSEELGKIELCSFIDDMAQAYLRADVVICRAGAMTISELAAVGVASILVPFPHAVDDHQTTNAKFLADAQAAVLMPQAELTPQRLAQWLQQIDRTALQAMAERARALGKPDAARVVADVCEQVAKFVVTE